MLKLVLFFVFISVIAYSVPVAIIDSGTDFEHYVIKNNLIAAKDIPGNNLDDDGNGYIDDAYGWNFADDTHIQANREIIPVSFPDYVKGLSILMNLSAEVFVASEDYEWLKDLWTGPNGNHFRQELNKTANFSHGTHVTGIVVRESDLNANVMAIQIMPTVEFSEGLEVSEDSELSKKTPRQEVTDEIIIDEFKKLAELYKDSWLEEIAMLTYRDVKIANCSFGLGYDRATQIIVGMCQKLGITCDDDRIDRLARAFLLYFKRPESERLISTNPDILFVIAAGNEGVNNDIYPDEPGNYITENRIVVAALDHTGINLASFSNYGLETVDIAAPGEVIESSYPNDILGLMSGTSQSAPFVTGVAASILHTNPNLTASELKNILIKTVDKKTWLEGKILSGGVVNKQRALRASEFSLSMDVDSAIESAREEIKDINEFRFNFRFREFYRNLSIPVDPSIKSFGNELIKRGRGEL